MAGAPLQEGRHLLQPHLGPAPEVPGLGPHLEDVRVLPQGGRGEAAVEPPGVPAGHGAPPHPLGAGEEQGLGGEAGKEGENGLVPDYCPRVSRV